MLAAAGSAGQASGLGGGKDRMGAELEIAVDRAGALPFPQVSIVIPTYQERANIRPLVAAVREALGGVDWEMIVVDDDSPDRTYEEVARVAREEPRVRCIRRIGRRGLSSAVLEGALAANADVIAVMDADFQHDERALRPMYEAMRGGGVDLVIGTRYAGEGGVGDWAVHRQRMSDLATRLAQLLVSNRTSDPLSGFFMVRQPVIAASIYQYSQAGYKILLDILSSSPVPLRIREVPYVFRTRRVGESKLTLLIVAEFVFLLIDKLSRGWIPPRFVMFALVGGLGLGVHLAVLYLLKQHGTHFLVAQAAAVGCAMLFNFIVNNEFTYRDKRLTGWAFLKGLLLFAAICSVGAVANIGVADLAIQRTQSWTIAGVFGAVMGAVFNFGAASKLVWNHRARPTITGDLAVTH